MGMEGSFRVVVEHHCGRGGELAFLGGLDRHDVLHDGSVEFGLVAHWLAEAPGQSEQQELGLVAFPCCGTRRGWGRRDVSDGEVAYQ
jgi:hypothetical protein